MSDTPNIYTPDQSQAPYLQFKDVLTEYLRDTGRSVDETTFERCHNINQIKKTLATKYGITSPAIKSTAGRITQGKMDGMLHYFIKDIPTNRYWLIKNRFEYEWPELLRLIGV